MIMVVVMAVIVVLVVATAAVAIAPCLVRSSCFVVVVDVVWCSYLFIYLFILN